jgi:hypothetical protein
MIPVAGLAYGASLAGAAVDHCGRAGPDLMGIAVSVTPTRDPNHD